ncbi:8612_t:CDS:1, partial [Cetraspora pellucida]
MVNEESTEWQDFLAKWNEIVQSATEDEFEVMWRNFRSTYANKSTAIIYLETIWIPWKERFVRAWTNKLFHLGTTVTFRIEGAHATLKAYLQGSMGDLYRVYMAISLVVTNQKNELDAMIASERIRIPVFATNDVLYTNVKGKISTFALKKINEQYQKVKHATAQEPLPPCTGSFTRTMGLPCAHIIQHFGNNQSLMLDNIHKHWWIPEHLPALRIEGNTLHYEALEPLLEDLQQKYQEWPESQQSIARETLKNIIDTPLILQNPH